jgi:hypothetical protein
MYVSVVKRESDNSAELSETEAMSSVIDVKSMVNPSKVQVNDK